MNKRLSPLFSWRSAIADSDLPRTVKLIALALSLYMSERGDSCFPAVKTLAGDASVSVRTARDALRVLEARGFLETERGGGKRADGRGIPNGYRAIVPPEAASK